MMKKTLLIILLFFTYVAIAQVPEKMSYQAVIRNGSNSLVINQPVGIKIGILQGSPNGAIVYQETHLVTTNANGLASLEIGNGNIQSGVFSTIDWAHGPFFLKTETDVNGGTNYNVVGTSQLISVPYALFAGNGIAGVSAIGDTLYLGNGGHIIIPGISNANNPQNISQHSCGADSVHNSSLTYGSMTDQSGNVYKTIVIGSQEWMAENLKTSHYRNGDLIPVVTDANVWVSLTTGATCWYNNDSATFDCPYGKLYNWYTVADARNVCPIGWHVPDEYDWNRLVKYLDPAADTICGGCFQSTIAGGDMKSSGFQYWLSPNAGATNQSGFSGLPSGGRDTNGSFFSLLASGNWWSVTPTATATAWNRHLYEYISFIGRDNNRKYLGFSVRCIKD